MSKPKKQEPVPAPDDRKKALQILVPALAVSALIVLIVIMVNLGSPSASPTKPIAPGSAKFDKFPLDAPEWKEIESGLKYWDAKEGTGDPCPTMAKVTVHYTGWTLDGNEFDSSKKRNEPSTFALDEVVKGWTKGIPGMKPGTVRRLYVPADLAYGSRARPGIPANSDLIFEVEMIKIN